MNLTSEKATRWVVVLMGPVRLINRVEGLLVGKGFVCEAQDGKVHLFDEGFHFDAFEGARDKLKELIREEMEGAERFLEERRQALRHLSAQSTDSATGDLRSN